MPSTPDEHYQFQQNEVNELNRQLNLMDRWGVQPSDPGYQALYRARGAAISKLGHLQARTTTLVAEQAGMSPGVIRLWADAELGWMAEARERPGAPPVYHYVSDEVARAIKTRTLAKQQELELMTPDSYEGE